MKIKLLFVSILFITQLISAILIAEEATYYGVAKTSSGLPVLWKTLPVSLCLSNNIPRQHRSSIRKAADVWNSYFPKKIFDLTCNTKVQKYSSSISGEKGIYWVEKGFHKFTDKTSLARTIRSFNEDTGELVDADILINAEFFDWTKNGLDLTTVLIHELGHALALKHNFISLKSALNYYPYQSGFIFRKLGNYELTTVKHFYFKDPAKIELYLHYYLNGQLDKAIQELEKAKNKPYSLGYLYKLNKKYSESIKYLTKALGKGQNNELVLYHIADSYWSKKDIPNAKLLFEKVVNINSNNYEAHTNLGAIEFGLGNISKAKKHFTSALSINPAHYIACFYLGRITKDTKYLSCLSKFSPDNTLSEILASEIEQQNCSWCIHDNTSLATKITRLSKLKPVQMLSAIRKDNVCIKILKSERNVPDQVFTWGSIEAPKTNLSEISGIKNIMGKTLCKKEHAASENCTTIIIANDAPKSTLIHEYLHVQQIRKDPKWCAFSKALWSKNEVSPDEIKKLYNKEWDVLKFLWLNRDQLSLDVQDKVTISAELIEQAKKRAYFDPSATELIRKEQVAAYLSREIVQYKKLLGTKHNE
ncbi:MAG: hypothetical protein HOO06_13620 [Bdellovibrionaceae bacterium]|jgi:tetratricopeptide (TPR) repeat protein|nr:hypothetical protein [Pseudobdellovibrionaceae bacterium]